MHRDGRSAGQVLRSLAAPIYIPTVLEASGETALLPVVPLLALSLGFTVPQAAALTMIAGVAAVLGPIPVARLMGWVGTRRAIVGSGLLLTAGNLAALLVIGQVLRDGAEPYHRWALVLLLVLVAATSQVWALGRQAYLGTALPPQMRARGMTTFGGMLRIGQVVGPLLGAGVLAIGHEAWVFGLFALLTLSATTMVALFLLPGEDEVPGPEGSRTAAGPDADGTEPDPVTGDDATPGVGDEGDLDDAVEEHARAAGPPGGADRTSGAPPGADDDASSARDVLGRMVRLGLGVTPIMMGRINRPVIVPLLGAGLGLDAATISVIFGVSAVLEIILFVPAGIVMDRWGRAAVAVPCSLIMGAGYLLLAVMASAADASGALLALLIPSLLIAFGNGLGSGIVMTLGIDVSPERGRTRYLAWWNSMIGIGRLSAPLLVAGVAAVAPVALAGALSGALCLIGGAWLARELPRVTPS
ncbi:MAG: MFS transporter [Brachybacterium sp.]|nr:MFS transporter [Brachybacterium sp.]